MNTKDPIECLREHYEHMTGVAKGLSTYVFTAADIEEIVTGFEAQYMKLPVDADGVPIHIGDMLLKSTGAPKASYGEVVGLSDNSVWFDAKNGWESNWSNLTRHAKPDTVESLLEELVLNHEWGYLSIVSNSDEMDEVISDYAERIRKAVQNEG